MEQRIAGEYDPYAIENWGPPLITDSVSACIHAPLTPNRREFDAEKTTLNFQQSDKSQSSSWSLYPKLAGLSFESLRSKPLFRGFERPNVTHIAILIVLCLVAYPALYIPTLVAKDKSLFTVRLIVAIWCSGVAFALGYTLLMIGVKHIEAASE